MGYFNIGSGEDFEIIYKSLEIKTVINGKLVVRNEQGEKYVAEAGDVLIFTPVTTVTFDAESDGYAIYTVHQLPERIENTSLIKYYSNI